MYLFFSFISFTYSNQNSCRRSTNNNYQTKCKNMYSGRCLILRFSMVIAAACCVVCSSSFVSRAWIVFPWDNTHIPIVNSAITMIKTDCNFLNLFLLNSLNICSLPYILKFIGNKLVTVYHSFVTISSEIRYFVTFNGIIRVNTPLCSVTLIVY